MNDRAAEFRRLGEAVYGAGWQTKLSRDIRVTDRTVRRWASGERDAPDDVMAALKATAEGRNATLDIGTLVARIARLWGELYDRNPAVARDLLSKLPLSVERN
jgi:hypothetical protein